MLELEVLVGELVTVDYVATTISPSATISIDQAAIRLVNIEILTGLATGTIALGEVTTLDHEVLDDTVESRALIAEALLAGSQSAEVLSSLGHRLAIQSQHDATQVLVAVLDVEIDLVGDLRTLGRSNTAAEEQHAHAEKQRGRDEKPPKVEHCEWLTLCFEINWN